MSYLDEAQLEIATVDYFRELGYEYIHGAHIALDLPAPGSARQAGGKAPERPVCRIGRDDYGQIVLVGRLRDALFRINPYVPT